ncbi:hypothetical protein JX265_003576 [Neoarthrinium moseri]|uniref:Ent-kaurene synthase n=1 Tax=Neoarthrinium moseri TaxID=1658444 RepID=A0A9P9WSD7_9PEZI|nr:hypothetical protein JX265_003576 [Neoarthrinium moseri]
MDSATELKSADELLAAAARSLITRASSSFHAYYGLSTTSCQVYDTAWVAMICKKDGEKKWWLFPESFYYLLKTQSEDGSWGSDSATQTAGILDTAAGLLALLKHIKEPFQINDVSSDEISKRIDAGIDSLKQQLAAWDDIQKSNHVGVEIIMPSLLTYIEEEHGTSFNFPSRSTLEAMNIDKMSRFSLESLYDKKPSSAVHSLEAFLGRVDMGRLSHHLYHGSMMASPSSTAAYLIGTTQWDDEAEAYLRYIMTAGAGHGDGGISGTFPTTYFEYSWILATFLKSGFSKKEIECTGMHVFADILRTAFNTEGGIIGFAPRTADVDDTAKGLLALSLLGYHVGPDQMIKVFEGQNHFTTFGSERDPSFTSNCHVLLALLRQPDVSSYRSQIRKTIIFISEWWWYNDHHIKDKWHLSYLYPTMLLTEALAALLQSLDQGELPEILDAQLECRVNIALFQSCLRVLLEQQADGSWNYLPEQTSYAILALSHARRALLFEDLQVEILSSISRGAQFLETCIFRSADLNWTSKTTYNVSFVAEAYKLAALKMSHSPHEHNRFGQSISAHLLPAGLNRYMGLVRRTPLFSEVPDWQIRASLRESSLFIPLLRMKRLQVYDRDDIPVTEDNYLDIIPFTWVGCNNRRGTFASASLLYELMTLSLYGYQTDEFMEAIAAPASHGAVDLHAVIDDVVNNLTRNTDLSCNGNNNMDITREIPNNGFHQGEPASKKISAALVRFVAYVLNHEAVARASAHDKQNLQRELLAFLHAHATQNSDNSRFKTQQQDPTFFTSAESSYFQWVRTTGGNHVACAYSFQFACCLISASLCSGKEVFPTVTEKYLAAALTRHLTTVCRMYNDFGSVSRDTAEGNVNSVHFPEFRQCYPILDGKLAMKKQALIGLAEYEQKVLEQTMQALERECERTASISGGSDLVRRKLSIVKLFCDVTDLYDQLYFLRDLSSTMK